MGRQLIGSDSRWFRRRKGIYSFSRTVFFFIDFTLVCYSLSSVAAVDTRRCLVAVVKLAMTKTHMGGKKKETFAHSPARP